MKMGSSDYTKWHLPKGAKARLGKGNINDVAYSPDGTYLAVAGSIGTWLYDMHTGEELTLLTGHSDTVSCVAYSPTGKTIATGSYDGTVRLWDTATRDHKITLPTHFTCWYGYNCITHLAQDIHSIGSDFDAVFLNKVTNIMYSPDGNTIVTCSGNFVQLWDAITGRHKVQIKSLNQFGDPNLQSVTYTSAGSVLVTQNTDRVIDFWDAATGKHKGKFTEARYRYRDDEFDDGFYERPEEISGIKTIACSPDGQTIALGYIDGTVKLWNPKAHKHTTIRGSEVSLPKAILREHTSTIWSLAFDTSGDILASGSSDGMICLWNAFTGERITTLTEHTTNIAELTYSSDGTVPLSTIVELTFSPNSTTLVSRNYGGVVSLWNIILNTYEERPFVIEDGIAEHKATLTKHTSVSSIGYSPDGETIATWSSDGVYLWNAATAEHKIAFTGHVFSISSIGYSPDGGTIATGSYGGVHLWNVATRQLKPTPTEQISSVSNIMYSPDGQTIAITREFDTTVRLLDAATGEHKTTLSGHVFSVSSIGYSPDGKTIATSDGQIYLWDVATGEHKTTLTEYAGPSSGLAYSPDGETIAIGGSHGVLYLCDAITGQHKATFTEHKFSRLAYSPDNSTIVTGSLDGKVHLWDVTIGQIRATLTEHASGVLSLSYSPDGKIIASGSQDGIVILWDTVHGKHRATLTGHMAEVHSVCFSPDGNTLATGSKDGTVLLWEIPSYKYSNMNPIEIHGDWRAGWALDIHTLSSRPLAGGGYDTKRTEFGESIYQLKYQRDSTKIQPIAEVAATFVKEKFAVDGYPILPYLKAIIPIPPSDRNRTFQPLTEVAREMGRLLSVSVRTDYLRKIKRTIPLKDISDVESKHEQLRGAFDVQSQDLKNQCVLLVDDLYDSGTTLTEATRVLYEQGGVRHVLVLALTRTRTGGN